MIHLIPLAVAGGLTFVYGRIVRDLIAPSPNAGRREEIARATADEGSDPHGGKEFDASTGVSASVPQAAATPVADPLEQARRIATLTFDKIVAPIPREFAKSARDLVLLARERDLMWQQRAGVAAREGINLRAVVSTLLGVERQQLMTRLDPENPPPENPQEQLARRRLGIAAASFAASFAAVKLSPALYVVGLAGTLYLGSDMLKGAFTIIVRERRLTVKVLDGIVMTLAIASGDLLAASALVFLQQALLFLLARTETVTKRDVFNVFSRQPRHVWALVDGVEVLLPFDGLRAGDIVIVHAGEMVPVDGEVVEGMAAVDQRMLTGEARSIDIGPGDSVLASGVVLTGRVAVRAERSGDDTVAAQVARILTDTSEFEQQIEKRAQALQDPLILPFFGGAALALLRWGVNPALAVLNLVPGYHMYYFGPVLLLSYMQVASRQNILVKSGRALERLKQVDTFVFDKTGTLTTEHPQVGRLFLFGEVLEEELLGIAFAAEQGQSHPVAMAVQRLARERGIAPARVDGPEVALGFGVRACIDGRTVLVGSDRLMSISGIALPTKALLEQDRVHAVGCSLVLIARDGEVLGGIEICPGVRPEAAGVIAELHRRCKEVIVISGDHEAPTRSLASSLGIDRWYAQVLPEEKSRIVEQLQEEGRVICFIGDGINDSIALRKADVSISMLGATTVATTAAQIVLMSNSLEHMGALLEISDRFDHHVRVNRVGATIPYIILATGALAFGWRYLTVVLLAEVSTLIGLYTIAEAASVPVAGQGESGSEMEAVKLEPGASHVAALESAAALGLNQV